MRLPPILPRRSAALNFGDSLLFERLGDRQGAASSEALSALPPDFMGSICLAAETTDPSIDDSVIDASSMESPEVGGRFSNYASDEESICTISSFPRVTALSKLSTLFREQSKVVFVHPFSRICARFLSQRRKDSHVNQALDCFVASRSGKTSPFHYVGDAYYRHRE